MFRCLKAYRHHQAAVKIQHHFSATKIQSYFRSWLLRKKFLDQVRAIIKVQSVFRMFRCLKAYRHYQAAVKIQHHLSATKIQSYFRSWLLRKKFIDQIRVIIKIQSVFRKFICLKTYRHYQITTKSATLIQSFVRGWIVRREACSHRNFIVAIQRHCRGWLVRRDFLFQRDAAINIQSVIRSLKRQKTFNCEKEAAKEIQRFVRGHIIRNRLIGASRLHAAIPTGCILKRPTDCYCFQLKLFLYSVLKLQRWWRGVLLFKLRSKCALTIQSHIRGWIARQKAIRDRHHIAVIQSHWKGYLVRKESRGLLLDLRLRMQKSAQNVDDGRRIINRLLAALSELLNMKSVSVTLHTCATLDMTTRHSQRCCEELVGAGAIGTLLQLIRSVSRSIPDQEVSKHALSTLRNLCRYPHLLEMLIDSHGSVEIILWELLRNKEDGYFVASEILKKICSNRKGFEAIRKLPALLKRLSTLVDELTRKTINEKRNPRGLGPAIREHTERRLKDAAELLRLATSS
ncbi:Abnormal spindle-like microcephaly-associated protein [Quillaja saponaria]|uniref:Abnormal spindle-like microcephaly-associated protein n=1 Tax=Quillaja saponaria TaxID=32244 RepID=A0AAD7M2V3_QUISA|nr:Abnormal spindle-like microcephaly-associated protein [Quillaja saponaria]